ncbi:hypothetical protein EJB05_56902, partial [Eragrostis curvula]
LSPISLSVFSLPPMEGWLLKAATVGDATRMKHVELHSPGVLLGTTPRGSTCLHISSAHGHQDFSKDAVALVPSLLQIVNAYGETPLVTAVTNGHVSLASFLLRCCHDRELSAEICKQDEDGCNVLHHAIRCGHRELALELIAAEPTLSRAVNSRNESPMFTAAMRDFTDVCIKLLDIPDSAYSGATGRNALHAATENGNLVIAKRIMETRPLLAWEEDFVYKSTPAHLAIYQGKTDVLGVMLEHDQSLGYSTSTDGMPLLVLAAVRGQVDAARELLSRCPDAPNSYRIDGSTSLHAAVLFDNPEFLEFILGIPQLQKRVNMQDHQGKTALHLAVQNCNPRMVAALLLHQDIDITVLQNNGNSAVWELPLLPDQVKTLNWNEVYMLMLQADPKHEGHIYNLHKYAKNELNDASRKDAKSLTQTYTSNTSLVAILISTITFAAAFTLPGGYSTDAGSEGLPIMAGKFAFQAFLISDTLAMCSSILVAFICVIARWGDFEFLLYYRSFTKKLMWFAYMATTMAFATGLYTVLAPRLLWLAITILVLSVLLPIVTYLLGKWPILKLRIRLGRSFNSEFLDMV